jgi:ATP synthase protein I
VNDLRELRTKVERQVERMRQAEADRPTLLAQAAFLGTLGLLLAIPVVGGAYLGRWLDEQRPGYSVAWTLGMVLAGLAVGVVNVWLFIRKRV